MLTTIRLRRQSLRVRHAIRRDERMRRAAGAPTNVERQNPVVIGDAVLFFGDCNEILDTLPEGSIDSAVVDPPYGLSFMSKPWDHDVPKKDVWVKVKRALKDGSHLLSFFGGRTYHRGAVEIEDAGFEVRDQIMWLYGSGFPKSRDISKDIDRILDAERKVVGVHPKLGWTKLKADHGVQTVNTTEFAQRSAKPVTDEAKRWNGWSTALKPAHEPICVARKPFKGSIARNVLAHGTGAMNIDACRVDLPEGDHLHNGVRHDGHALDTAGQGWGFKAVDREPGLARWPANVIHDGSEEVLAHFPSTRSPKSFIRRKASGNVHAYGAGIGDKEGAVSLNYGDGGSAARFFYCPKASPGERGDNNHPTVKPLRLMEYLIRLVTSRGGTVLDPYMGSGSTCVAALAQGMKFVGIERDEHSFEIAVRRAKEFYDREQAA